MDDGAKAPGAARRGATSGIPGAEFAGIGVQFALTILIFVFGGVWLDGRLGSSPWFVLVGVFVGAVGGFYSMYRKVAAVQRREAAERAKRVQEGR